MRNESEFVIVEEKQEPIQVEVDGRYSEKEWRMWDLRCLSERMMSE